MYIFQYKPNYILNVVLKTFLLAHTDIKTQCMNLNNGDKQNIQLGKGDYNY